MIAFPHCKINLGLHVIRKREDGFHDIETVFYPIFSLYDALEIIPSKEFTFTTSGIPLHMPPTATNICVNAYQLLNQDYELPAVQIHLHKAIPHGAGLGGGSSDAAFTIKLLNELFELQLSDDQMLEYCRKLGSDCAFFIKQQPVYATGKGDVFTDINLNNLKEHYIVLVKPDISVGTAEAYANLTPRNPDYKLSTAILQPLNEWKNIIKNDFENTVFNQYPFLAEIKQNLYKQ